MLNHRPSYSFFYRSIESTSVTSRNFIRSNYERHWDICCGMELGSGVTSLKQSNSFIEAMLST